MFLPPNDGVASTIQVGRVIDSSFEKLPSALQLELGPPTRRLPIQNSVGIVQRHSGNADPIATVMPHFLALSSTQVTA